MKQRRVWFGGASSQSLPESVSYCLNCHDHKQLSLTLKDRSIMSLYVNPREFAQSVHGSQLICTDCHARYDQNHPSGATFPSTRAYVIAAYETCKKCHPPAHGARKPQPLAARRSKQREQDGRGWPASRPPGGVISQELAIPRPGFLGVGLLKPDPKNLDPLCAMVPHLPRAEGGEPHGLLTLLPSRGAVRTVHPAQATH